MQRRRQTQTQMHARQLLLLLFPLPSPSASPQHSLLTPAGRHQDSWAATRQPAAAAAMTRQQPRNRASAGVRLYQRMCCHIQSPSLHSLLWLLLSSPQRRSCLKSTLVPDQSAAAAVAQPVVSSEVNSGLQVAPRRGHLNSCADAATAAKSSRGPRCLNTGAR